MALVFEWDPGKAKLNLNEHGVSFEEASTVFQDPLSITVADPGHSRSEARFLDIGMTQHHELLVVSYTERQGGIRIISARPSTRTERRSYEETS